MAGGSVLTGISASETLGMLPGRSKMAENREECILRYSFSTFMVKIFPILLRLYAINIRPTSALALALPFFVSI